MQNQTTNEFMRAFKRFISQRAVPEKKYSDSAKAFVASFKWVKYLNKSKAFNHIFNINKIQWRFNLSRVPWWKVVMVPRSIRKYHFSCEEFAPQNLWRELGELLLDTEKVLKFEFLLLLPNLLNSGQNLPLPYETPGTKNKELHKRFKCIWNYKEVTWERWRKEYIKALKERQYMKTEEPM